jgi:hypothetical protein
VVAVLGLLRVGIWVGVTSVAAALGCVWPFARSSSLHAGRPQLQLGWLQFGLQAVVAVMWAPFSERHSVVAARDPLLPSAVLLLQSHN